MNYLIDVLLGKVTPRIEQLRHDQVSTFGIGKEYQKYNGALYSVSLWPEGLLQLIWMVMAPCS